MDMSRRNSQKSFSESDSDSDEISLSKTISGPSKQEEEEKNLQTFQDVSAVSGESSQRYENEDTVLQGQHSNFCLSGIENSILPDYNDNNVAGCSYNQILGTTDGIKQGVQTQLKYRKTQREPTIKKNFERDPSPTPEQHNLNVDSNCSENEVLPPENMDANNSVKSQAHQETLPTTSSFNTASSSPKTSGRANSPPTTQKTKTETLQFTFGSTGPISAQLVDSTLVPDIGITNEAGTTIAGNSTQPLDPTLPPSESQVSVITDELSDSNSSSEASQQHDSNQGKTATALDNSDFSLSLSEPEVSSIISTGSDSSLEIEEQEQELEGSTERNSMVVIGPKTPTNILLSTEEATELEGLNHLTPSTPASVPINPASEPSALASAIYTPVNNRSLAGNESTPMVNAAQIPVIEVKRPDTQPVLRSKEPHRISTSPLPILDRSTQQSSTRNGQQDQRNAHGQGLVTRPASQDGLTLQQEPDVEENASSPISLGQQESHDDPISLTAATSPQASQELDLRSINSQISGLEPDRVVTGQEVYHSQQTADAKNLQNMQLYNNMQADPSHVDSTERNLTSRAFIDERPAVQTEDEIDLRLDDSMVELDVFHRGAAPYFENEPYLDQQNWVLVEVENFPNLRTWASNPNVNSWVYEDQIWNLPQNYNGTIPF